MVCAYRATCWPVPPVPLKFNVSSPVHQFTFGAPVMVRLFLVSDATVPTVPPLADDVKVWFTSAPLFVVGMVPATSGENARLVDHDVLPLPSVSSRFPAAPFDPGRLNVVVPATAGTPTVTVPEVDPGMAIPALNVCALVHVFAVLSNGIVAPDVPTAVEHADVESDKSPHAGRDSDGTPPVLIAATNSCATLAALKTPPSVVDVGAGSRAAGSVPLVMFAAFVVSVVAEAARPETPAAVTVCHDVLPLPSVRRKLPAAPFVPGSVKVVVPATAGGPTVT